MPSTGRPQKYPWNQWFDDLEQPGVQLRLVHGEDFYVPPPNMRRQLLTEARRRGVALRTRLGRDRSIVVSRVVRVANYPWDDWLAGQQQELRPGRDFKVDVEVMREQARRAARTRGLDFRSKQHNGSLWIQGLQRVGVAPPTLNT